MQPWRAYQYRHADGILPLTQILPGDSALAELQGAIAKATAAKARSWLNATGRRWRWRANRWPKCRCARSMPQPEPPAGGLRRRAGFRQNRHRRDAGRARRCATGLRPAAGRHLADGHHALGKRNIAEEIPIWKEELCTQCNHCVAACPHSAIRAKVVPPEAMENAPASLHSLDVKSRDMRGQKYVLQVAPEDCTGCNLCVEVCPAKTGRIRRSRPSI
jgi:pyruvate-ferredoxin/flavodoxin oxidoreductase